MEMLGWWVLYTYSVVSYFHFYFNIILSLIKNEYRGKTKKQHQLDSIREPNRPKSHKNYNGNVRMEMKLDFIGQPIRPMCPKIKCLNNLQNFMLFCTL
jgi:hypothetical protein